MASQKFVVTLRRIKGYDAEGNSVYPCSEPDPIEFPNLNSRQMVRLVELALNSVDFDAEWKEAKPYEAPCPYTHAHTRHWCGNSGCRDS